MFDLKEIFELEFRLDDMLIELRWIISDEFEER